MAKRLLAMLLALVMCLGCFSMAVFAEDETEVSCAAKIGDTEYASLTAAIGAAQPGETIELLRDVTPETEGVSGFELYITKSITLEMNGHSIRTNAQWDAIDAAGVTFTIRNSTDTPVEIYGEGEPGKASYSGIYLRGHVIVDGKITISGSERGAYVAVGGYSITLKNGAELLGRSTYGVYGAETVSITLENAKITGTGNKGIYVGKADSSISVSGPSSSVANGILFAVAGTLTVKDVSLSSLNVGKAAALEQTYAANDDGSITYTYAVPEAIDETQDKPEARLNGVEYETFAEAYAKAESGDTITLLARTVELPYLNKSDITIEGTEKDGKNTRVSIAYSSGKSINAKNLTIKNVIFGLNGGYIYPTSTCENITFEGCEFRYRIAAMGENYTFKDCLFNGENGIYYAAVKGTMVLDGCTFDVGQWGFHNSEKTCQITVKNCNIGCWCAVGPKNTLSIENSTFYAGMMSTYYNALSIYCPATIKNCDFQDDYFVAPMDDNVVVEMENCTFTEGNTVKEAASLNGKAALYYINMKVNDAGEYIGGMIHGDSTEAEKNIADEFELRAIDGYDENWHMVAHIEHQWGEWIQSRPASYTQPSQDTRTCSVCGETETRTNDDQLSETVIGDEDPPLGGDPVDIPDDDTPLGGTVGLNTADHIAYISGYADGTVRPGSDITREEVAMIFYRLLDSTAKETYGTVENNFSDVPKDRWSNEAISTLAKAGILEGYKDGTFGPQKSITRAEFVTVATRFTAAILDAENIFSDTEDHWAKGAIAYAHHIGWINGYADGTFKPGKQITRAEVVTIVNKMLDRSVDAEGLIEGYKQWSDNAEGMWYYFDIIEASSGHNYERRAEGSLVENWITGSEDVPAA